MKNTKHLFALGQGCLVLAVIVKYTVVNSMFAVYSIGFFTGLSIVFNIVFLVRKIKEKRSKNVENIEDKFRAS
ncbi:MAG TPA: hypothetical protein VHO90_06485 [Bacteroidales bacterium]|nr:hypothetical protein [Bacteroidales bacterium]